MSANIRETIEQPETIIFMLVFGLIVIGVIALWVFITLPIWIKAVITLIFAVSLYYQTMAFTHGITTVTIRMQIEDKIVNELTYQMQKRGHTITFLYTSDGGMSIKSYSCPRPTAKFIRFISLIHVMLKPGWNYRDVDEDIERQ